MENKKRSQIFEFVPYDNKKYALFSPLLGAFAIFLCLIVYASITLSLSGKVPSFADGVLSVIYTIPTFLSISIVFSYLLSLGTLLPTYKKRQDNAWSNGRFWFLNSLLGTIIGIVLVVLTIWKMGFLFAFMIFTSCFFASMFTSSMYTTLISITYSNNQEKLTNVKN